MEWTQGVVPSVVLVRLWRSIRAPLLVGLVDVHALSERGRFVFQNVPYAVVVAVQAGLVAVAVNVLAEPLWLGNVTAFGGKIRHGEEVRFTVEYLYKQKYEYKHTKS